MKKLFYSFLALAMTAMTFNSCEDVPAPYDDPNNNNNGGGGTVVIDPAGTGTQDDPFNVMAAINYAQQLEVGAESSQNIYIKGVVVSIAENYTTQYGNARFYISDDGTARNQFLIYRALYLGNKKYTEGDLLQEGDTVIVCGIVTNYNGTIETQQNKAFLYSLNGKTEGGGGGQTGEAKGSGTLADPYNPVGAALAVANLTWTSNDDYQTTSDVYVKGKISRIADNGTFTGGGTYGNASFYISEDGTQNGEFYCFRILYLGNKKFESGKTDIKVGDEVIVYGQLMNYRGNTPETVAGKAYLYSLNGKSEGESESEIYTLVTTISDGKYAIAARKEGNTFVAAQALSGNYGYLYTTDVTLSGNVISKVASNNVFYIKSATGGYTIQDADGQYLYMTGTYNSFNRSTEQPSEGALWDFSFNSDGAAIIRNTMTGKTIQYSSQYSSYGAYTDISNTLPSLFKGGDSEDVPVPGPGTYDSPLTVTQAISLANADAAWVKGYIVGYVTGQVLSTGARFTSTAPENETVSNTNLLIAASASETDVNKCMPIQLSRDYRADFALDANPGLLGKQIIIAGQLTAYFGVPGLKSPTYIEAEGKSLGNKVKHRRR